MLGTAPASAAMPEIRAPAAAIPAAVTHVRWLRRLACPCFVGFLPISFLSETLDKAPKALKAAKAPASYYRAAFIMSPVASRVQGNGCRQAI
jgi:hypothetical protein